MMDRSLCPIGASLLTEESVGTYFVLGFVCLMFALWTCISAHAIEVTGCNVSKGWLSTGESARMVRPPYHRLALAQGATPSTMYCPARAGTLPNQFALHCVYSNC